MQHDAVKLPSDWYCLVCLSPNPEINKKGNILQTIT